MKKLPLLLFLFPLAFISCDLGGENYARYYDYVDIDEMYIPDSAMVGDTVPVYARAGAPNGCWSELELYCYPYNDTLYLVNASGLYESHDGVCPEIYVTLDSTFRFIPDSAGIYIFVAQSKSKQGFTDTLVVSPMR